MLRLDQTRCSSRTSGATSWRIRELEEGEAGGPARGAVAARSAPAGAVTVARMLAVFLLAVAGRAAELALPSYHYGAPIRVECMNRSS